MEIQEKPSVDDSSSAMSDLTKDELEPQNVPQPHGPERVLSSDVPEEEIASSAPPGLDWDGPEDPDNPQNWQLASKIYHVTIPGLFCFAV